MYDNDMFTMDVYKEIEKYFKEQEEITMNSYSDETLNEVFTYDNSLKEGSYYVMYTIARQIEKALSKWETCVTAKVERMEFEELGEEGIRKVLSLLHDEYNYDLEIAENPKEYEDRASVFIYWEYEEIE